MIRAHLFRLVGLFPGVGSLLRRLADRHPDGSVTTIRSGVAAGRLWRRRKRYVNGYWIGHYEIRIQRILKRELSRGDVFYDLGANAGFFSLVAQTIVGKEGIVVAIDPDPTNGDNIRDIAQLNGIENIRIVPAAVTDGVGQALFPQTEPGSPMARLGEPRAGEESVWVDTVTVDSLAAEHGWPDFAKVDVEGAEGRVLVGAAATLERRRTVWLIELHGADCAEEVWGQLTSLGYEIYSLTGDRIGAAFGRDIFASGKVVAHVIGRPPQLGAP